MENPRITNWKYNFSVVCIDHSANPEATAWYAMHQCYSEGDVELEKLPMNYGDAVVKNLLNGHKGHYSPLEHNSMVFNAVGFPHSLMQQLTRHRIGIGFSVQSMRYSGDRIIDVATGKADIESVFYLRPVGKYASRDGFFEYTQSARDKALAYITQGCYLYHENVKMGMPKEQARGTIAFDFRQNFVVSFNARSLMHVLDLRAKKDAQHEIQLFSDMLFSLFEQLMPNVAKWYQENRMGKARLAP